MVDKNAGIDPDEDRGDEFEPTDDEVALQAEDAELVVEPEEEEIEVAEPEDEPEEEKAAKEEPEEEEPKEHFIPKGRFDEVNAKRKEAERRLAEYEEREAAARKAAEAAEEDTYDFEAKETEYLEAVIDGDINKAKALRSEIRAAERAQVEREAVVNAERRAREIYNSVAQETIVEKAVAEVNTKYPVFDTESDVFDQDLTNEAIAMAQAYQNQGLDFPTALNKAVNNVAKLYDLTPAGAAKQPAPKAKVDPEKVQAKIDAAEQQPPKGKGASVKEAAIDIESMSDAEFNALPKSVKARLRGDQ